MRAALRGVVLDAPVRLVAIGKAAGAMTCGALDALDRPIDHGLVVTKHGYTDPALRAQPRLTVIEAGHPVPDRHSLAAGARLVPFVRDAPADTSFLFLISGGASALVEVLPRGVGLADLARANRWLLASGLPIGAMNRLRKQWSCIKGGRLATCLAGRRALNLLISDVPGDAAGDIGSGLLVPDAAGAALLAEEGLPPWLARMGTVPRETAGPAGAGVETRIVATAATARRAAVAAARRLGYAVTGHRALVTGDAAAAGRRLAGLVVDAGPGIHIFSGETTVALPPRPGRGGRNQHLALAAAQEIAGRPDLLLLAGATDGSDGPGEEAGALVDGATLERGARAGLDSVACLKAADSGRFLDAAGALIRTGPTGTNVMDLLLALRARP